MCAISASVLVGTTVGVAIERHTNEPNDVTLLQFYSLAYLVWMYKVLGNPKIPLKPNLRKMHKFGLILNLLCNLMNMNTVWVAFIIQSSYNEVTIQILIEKNTYVITNFSNIERKLLCKSCSPDPTINFWISNLGFLRLLLHIQMCFT